MRRAAAAVAALGIMLVVAGCGSDDEGGEAKDCVGKKSGEVVQKGTDAVLDDGSHLAIAWITTEDGGKVTLTVPTTDTSAKDLDDRSVGDTFTSGGAERSVEGICTDAVWVSGPRRRAQLDVVVPSRSVIRRWSRSMWCSGLRVDKVHHSRTSDGRPVEGPDRAS